eukprot:CAMPEP_0117453230 /NCGR_PEP_ID=MMETSP0759-20121206/10099_1 /TAXON_ID=63605 /ORGANISM="Percolomonas cosmopolitus, Strain WS" /LENGTH=536 /DNA_ID=CAMNT_0005246221 /DNA_START=54 /DNA_END=1665 /DNA_ORIENTATION=-
MPRRLIFRLSFLNPLLRLISEIIRSLGVIVHPLKLPERLQRLGTSRKRRRWHRRLMRKSHKEVHSTNLAKICHRSCAKNSDSVLNQNFRELYGGIYNVRDGSDFWGAEPQWRENDEMLEFWQDASSTKSPPDPQIIYVHKALLCATSSHFRKLLSRRTNNRQTKTSQKKNTPLPEEPTSWTAPYNESAAWSVILPFLYGLRDIDIEDSHFDQCYQVASKYDIRLVRDYIAGKIEAKICDMDNPQLLLERCLTLNMHETVTLIGRSITGKGFQTLLQSVPWKTILNLLNKRIIVLTDEELFQQIAQYCETHQDTLSLEQQREMFSRVNLQNITIDTLSTKVNSLVEGVDPEVRVIPLKTYIRALHSHTIPYDPRLRTKRSRKFFSPPEALFQSHLSNPYGVCFLNGGRSVRPVSSNSIAIIPITSDRCQRIKFRVTTGSHTKRQLKLQVGFSDFERAGTFAGNSWENAVTNLVSGNPFHFKHNMERTFVLNRASVTIYNAYGEEIVKTPLLESMYNKKSHVWFVYFGDVMDVAVTIV